MANSRSRRKTAINSRAILSEYNKQDLEAHGIERWRPIYWVTRPEIRFQRALRSVEYWSNKTSLIARLVWSVKRLILFRVTLHTGISIPPGVFGPGLAVAHPGSVVVNSDAIVGRNCRVHSGTNIGSSSLGAPRIGDNVYIGPGAVIYGAIVVGDNVAIGANAVVNRDVAADVTVGGVPARVISSRGSDGIHPNYSRTAGRQ
ncbi:serine O-acetyltransferase [Rhodococcus jostii]|uniref:Serine O-acetyltransferase n=1 Tax=Rhodococcus jostii TaxID=132919 RepID=A0A1H5HL54_RHOJO|nr:serine O-acetyltransferase [Rhodococcus jostii]